MMWRRPRPESIRAYNKIVNKLLIRHALRVPESTTEMLTRAVMKCRRGGKPDAGRSQTRERLRSALSHAEALLRYSANPPTRGESIEKRSETLHDVLDSPDAIIWLGVAVPPVDVPNLLHRLDAGGLDADELIRLIQAINHTLSLDGARTGHPMERSTTVVRAGCIAWFQAHRKDSYNTWSGQQFADTPLAKFLRDLLNCCWLYLSDQALYSAAKAARRDIRNHYPRIAS